MVAKRYVSPLDDGMPERRLSPPIWRGSSIPCCVVRSPDLKLNSEEQ